MYYRLIVDLKTENIWDSFKETIKIFIKYGLDSNDAKLYLLHTKPSSDGKLYWMNKYVVSKVAVPVSIFTKYKRTKLKQELTNLDYKWCIERKTA